MNVLSVFHKIGLWPKKEKTMNDTATTITVFKGNLGYYPCSYETMKKLKRLNQYAHWMEGRKTQIDRMMRKLPHNRVKKVKLYDEQGRFTGHEKRPWVQPEVYEFSSKLYTYAWQARHPVATAEEVKPIGWSEDHIDRLLDEVSQYFGK